MRVGLKLVQFGMPPLSSYYIDTETPIYFGAITMTQGVKKLRHS